MEIAKLFTNGKSQAVRLPKKYRFEGKEVYIKRIGDTIVLIPKDNPWGPFIKSLAKFTDDFLPRRDEPKLERRRGL
jgi:antitoxin VapB